MNKIQHIILKVASRDKWEYILFILQHKELSDAEAAGVLPSLSSGDCGYCAIHPVECDDCPLYTKSLCRDGDGEAYCAVSRFGSRRPDSTRESAITGAKELLAAIVADLRKEGFDE